MNDLINNTDQSMPDNEIHARPLNRDIDYVLNSPCKCINISPQTAQTNESDK